MGWSGIKYLFHAKSCTSPRRITVEKGFDCGLFFYPQDVMLWTVHVLGDVYRIGGRPYLVGSPWRGGNPFERVLCPAPGPVNGRESLFGKLS